MNLRKPCIVPRNANHCKLCDESTECIKLGESPMSLSVRNNQRIAWTKTDIKG
jgi:hypothetical protein